MSERQREGEQPRDEERAGESDAAAEEGEDRQARDELFEAIGHFRNAATLFFDRARNDPAVKNAAGEAERVVQKIGETAEPFARQLTGELGRLTKRITDTYQQTVEGRRRRKSDEPPEGDG